MDLWAAVDGTLIKVSPKHDNHYNDFITRKGFTAINAAIVGGASLKIFYVDASWPGSAHDSKIFRDTKLYRKLDNPITRPHPGMMIVADSAYQVTKVFHQFLNYIGVRVSYGPKTLT